ncbi:ATP-binding protein [Streptomyces gelaticus]
MQLAIASGVTVLATGLFLAPLSAQLDDQAMRRALAIAQSTAAQPRLTEELLATDPSPTGPVQSAAEQVRRATGAEYVVVMDRRGVRWSHPDADEIGKVVSTDPSDALAGRNVMEIDSGTLGRSARGKVPLRDDTQHIVGAVSVGIAYDSVRARLLAAIPGLFAYAGGALAVGAPAACLISRRLQRRTHDLAFSDISALLTEREAMLHGIREGVVALDRTGRIRLLNDEAQRLLGLGPDAAGRPLQVTEKVHDPLLAALLVGKATVAAERGVALRIAPGTLLPDRLVDPRGLVTVVGNLVDNALDAVAGADGALVEVGLRAVGRTVELRVRDSGPGVPAGHRESIFTEGWSTKEIPAHGKRGLGLALVRRLAERQGGGVTVDGAADGGAEFTVVLPEALADTELTEPEATGPEAAERAGLQMTESDTGVVGEAQ